MSPKVDDRPILVQVGQSFVDPLDVAAIVKVKSKEKLFIIRLKSQPNAEFPFWATERELGALFGLFNIVENDG